MKKPGNEYPLIYDDRDKGYGEKFTDICPTQRAERNGLKVVEMNGGGTL